MKKSASYQTNESRGDSKGWLIFLFTKNHFDRWMKKFSEKWKYCKVRGESQFNLLHFLLLQKLRKGNNICQPQSLFFPLVKVSSQFLTMRKIMLKPKKLTKNKNRLYFSRQKIIRHRATLLEGAGQAFLTRKCKKLYI